ncbi:MAG: HIT domain-containing protein [Candidatus Doudnabacteria bacterium]|nr:HIT domain-containing protein [Candidatus Doudnabacteria bacterium]
MFTLIRKFIVLVVVLFIGVIIGSYITSHIRPRNFISIKNCNENCFKSNELLGLLGSIGIKLDRIPDVVYETDKNIVIKHPNPSAPIHYVIIPKKDIRSIEDITIEDQEYIMDSFAVVRELVKRDGLEDYRVMTNGPGYQEVSYLHFHLTARK